MKLNAEVCSKTGINHSKLTVLKYIIEHFSSKFLPLNIYKIEKEFGLSYSSVSNAIRFLSQNNIIVRKFNFSKLQLYIKLKYPNCNKYIIAEEDKGNNEMLIDINEDKFEICREADLIAKYILKKYSQYFSHRPMRSGRATNLYRDICRCICDVYNGNFLNSRLYDLKYDFDWKKTIKNVRGNWLETRRLILNNLKNFDLMHQKEYLPYNKAILKDNLKEWFYDDNRFRHIAPTSQFLECFYPPEYVSRHFSEKKADEIFNSLPHKAQAGGNGLFGLNDKMASGRFWEYVRNMVEWAKIAWKCDDNMTSWLESPSDIVEQFYKYCKSNNISVSLNTCDIQKAVECNAPWVWFVQDACNDYGINKKIAKCATLNDFEKYFNLS